MPSEEEMEIARFNRERPDLKRCDMCDNPAMHQFMQEGHKLDLCGVCYVILTNQQEIDRFKKFWIEKYTDLHETVTKMAHAMGVAIGVRNTKIAELKGKLTTLEKQLKTLTEQGDLNTQTLEGLQ